jgi:hypothetical protein
VTNWFEQYYPQLLDYASSVVFNKGLMADPCELVNDAYLKFVDSDDEFDFDRVKGLISNASFRFVRERMEKRAVGTRKTAKLDGWVDYSYKPVKITDDRACVLCHEVKPVNAFRFHKYDGFTCVANRCRECENKRNAKWLKSNAKRWNEYVRRRYALGGRNRLTREQYNAKRSMEKKTIQELWNRANKKRYEKEKENLADSYIKRILKAAKKPFTPVDIEKKREELWAKRRNKAA